MAGDKPQNDSDNDGNPGELIRRARFSGSIVQNYQINRTSLRPRQVHLRSARWRAHRCGSPARRAGPVQPPAFGCASPAQVAEAVPAQPKKPAVAGLFFMVNIFGEGDGWEMAQ